MEGISVGLPFICFPFNVSNFYMAEVLAQKGVATALDIREPDYHLLYTTFKNALEIHLSRSILQLIHIILHQESPLLTFSVKPRPTLFCMYFFMIIGKRLSQFIFWICKEKFRPFWGHIRSRRPGHDRKCCENVWRFFNILTFIFDRNTCSQKNLWTTVFVKKIESNLLQRLNIFPGAWPTHSPVNTNNKKLKNWMNYKNEFPNYMAPNFISKRIEFFYMANHRFFTNLFLFIPHSSFSI